ISLSRLLHIDFEFCGRVEATHSVDINGWQQRRPSRKESSRGRRRSGRVRLLSRGAQALTDAELVAILVRVGFKGTSAVEPGRQLLRRFGSLRAMVEAPVIALLEVKGLKGAKAAQLLAAMEIARRVAVPAQRSALVIKSTTGAA